MKTKAREPLPLDEETAAGHWAMRRRGILSGLRYTENGSSRVYKDIFSQTIAKTSRELKKPWLIAGSGGAPAAVSFGKSGRWALAARVASPGRSAASDPAAAASEALGAAVAGVLSSGLGVKPILAADAFCARAPSSEGSLPDSGFCARRAALCLIEGFAGYGNRMGVPLAAGSICFDSGFAAAPAVFAGCVGIAPRAALKMDAKPGDLIAAAGVLAQTPGGSALDAKKLADALLCSGSRRLYRMAAAGGSGGLAEAAIDLASAAGGARLDLSPLAVRERPAREIWFSRSAEFFLLAVPKASWKELEKTFSTEDCPLALLGELSSSGRLAVSLGERPVLDLELRFLREDMPQTEKIASWTPAAKSAKASPRRAAPSKKPACGEILRSALAHLNVCSRESVIRRYDYEAQGGTVIKPLQGIRHDGPGDACVIWPYAATGDMGDFSGLAFALGINPSYGKIDPYWAAISSADEALRNLLCVGADISRAVFLGNFCRTGPETPQTLGALVRAALGLNEAAKGFQTPFISGAQDLCGQSLGAAKDSPGALLVCAAAPIDDARKALTMDVKGPGNALYLLGRTGEDFGGSLYSEICALGDCGIPPKTDARAALKGFYAARKAVAAGLVLSAHDVSEGGLAAAAAEMAFSGEFGIRLDLDGVSCKAPIYDPETLLFSETPSRILFEVSPEKEAAFLKAAKGAPALSRVGQTIANPILKAVGLDGACAFDEPIAGLKALWQKTLPEALG
ncbi:MAG: AIR synthase-related protein [Elusimicrobiota bacterium]